ncbi:unnamed protein product [Cylindrotheca closterium]|uniref:Uncharacterized protein n=1 Tax=Cylindrotheca closterium TaxID=2856 RepID=A0AAD2GAF6_9STRA|nr:unnamed protein product [Cylindrotheca closterium]
MAMQEYLSLLLKERSADTIVFVRDDAKVEQDRRIEFNNRTKQTNTTCPWKPLSKCRAPTLPSRTNSVEDLGAVVSKLAECEKQVSRVSSKHPSFDDEEDDDENADFSPFDTLSKEFMLQRPLHKRNSLDTGLTKISSVPLKDPDESPRSRSRNRVFSDSYLETQTPNVLIQHERRRSEDYLTLSHAQHMNLNGGRKINRTGGSIRRKARNNSTEAPPVIPFRKESDDDLAWSSSKQNRKEDQEVVETSDSTILNSTWEPLQQEHQRVSNCQKKKNLLSFFTDTLSDEETRWLSLYDRPF